MRIEKCVEHDGKKITVWVEDNTVRATNTEAVKALIQAIGAAMERLGSQGQ